MIRGVAVLGILIMNIQSFSMPGAAYLNPLAYGDFTGANYWIWLFSHIFADMKFMSIFSMLFGAGILVFCDRAEIKPQGAARLHYRRNFWLLVFGLLHAHLLWYGDILYSYAMCAFLMFWMRHLSVKQLLTSSFLFLFIGSAYSLLLGVSLPEFPQDVITELNQAWSPDESTIAQEITAYRGGFSEQIAHRSPIALAMETELFLTSFLWRIVGMMCLGMALYRTGVLTLQRSSAFYWRLVGCCFPTGLILVCIGVWQNQQHDFQMEFSFFLGSQWNYWGSILLAVSYIGLICIWLNSGNMQTIKVYLAATGRMAFTHYIMQTLIFTGIFYGHGLGLFGSLERWQAFIMIVAVWSLQIWISPRWLNRYQQGPLEKLWRKLTYSNHS